MIRMLSLWLPHWATRALSDSMPCATVEAVRGVRLIGALNAVAEGAGLRVGQKLADARAICPALDVVDADPAADRAALARLAVWAERYTPLAAVDAPDGVWLDITGCAHLWGGEAALLADLQGRLAGRGWAAKCAIAGTAGAAWALARVPGQPAILPPGTERAALATLPTAALRLDGRTVAALRRVGLRSVGQMARLPRAELSARFGPWPVLRLDQAVGIAAEAIAWPHPPAPWEERLACAEPILTPEDLGRALRLLADRLCARLAADGAGGHRFTAEFFRVDGARPVISVGTARPVRDPGYVARLLTAKLEEVDPEFGIEVMRLSADGVDAMGAVQVSLDGRDAVADALPATVDQIANRLSPQRIWRMAPRSTHVPERAARRVAPLEMAAWPASDLPRPIRLLRRPEPIEAIAPVPDDPPVQFRWRGVVHRVHAAAGPERIAREWWRHPIDDTRPEPDRVRDYYRVEDMAGGRFWIFRTGLSGAPNWYLHGLFA